MNLSLFLLLGCLMTSMERKLIGRGYMWTHALSRGDTTINWSLHWKSLKIQGVFSLEPAAVSRQYFFSDLSRSKYHRIQTYSFLRVDCECRHLSSGGLCLTDPSTMCNPHFWFQLQDHTSPHSNVPGAFNLRASPEFYTASLKSVFCELLCQLLLFHSFPVDFSSMNLPLSCSCEHYFFIPLFALLNNYSRRRRLNYVHYIVIVNRKNFFCYFKFSSQYILSIQFGWYDL